MTFGYQWQRCSPSFLKSPAERGIIGGKPQGQKPAGLRR